MRKPKEQQQVINPESSDYPDGSLKDGTPSNPKGGSSILSCYLNDVIGLCSALLKKANGGDGSFNGNPETANYSEIADAIETISTKAVNGLRADSEAKYALKEDAQINKLTVSGETVFNNKAPIFKAGAISENTIESNSFTFEETLFSTSGDIELKNGDISTRDGDIGTTFGNIQADKGNISAQSMEIQGKPVIYDSLNSIGSHMMIYRQLYINLSRYQYNSGKYGHGYTYCTMKIYHEYWGGYYIDGEIDVFSGDIDDFNNEPQGTRVYKILVSLRVNTELSDGIYQGLYFAVLHKII